MLPRKHGRTERSGCEEGWQALQSRLQSSLITLARQILAQKAAMPLKTDLDAIDWKILRELQREGRITNVELSSRVGISAPPCLRRVKRLEDAGIIRGYRALLNAPALGLDVVAFCLIGLHHQSETELKAFADRTRNWPVVRAAWMVSGESDFMLHCVASDLATFQGFVIEELTSAPNVDTVRTALTIRQIKDEGPVAI
jgi:DNA-binding Lrp family transcriptional regulator